MCSSVGLARISLDTTKNYSFTYGTPIAAGGRERPITPATTTRVKTYGNAWNSTAVDSEKAGSRWASAVEKPNRHAPASAPQGRQPPKITAASAINPRPAVICSLKEPTSAIDRYAPPAAASAPEATTAR